MLIGHSRLFEILNHTSRSFAIGIRLLDEPLRSRICLGYLLCRLFDTYEDSTVVDGNIRMEGLELSGNLLNSTDIQIEKWDQNFSQWQNHRKAHIHLFSNIDPWEQTLMNEADLIFENLLLLPQDTRQVFADSLRDMVSGMKNEIRTRQLSVNPVPRSLDEVDTYCYSVAGTVGVLLHGLVGGSKDLYGKAIEFGKTLQLANIIKDFHKDWKEGRCFWPLLPHTPGSIHSLPEFPDLETVFHILRERFFKYLQSAEEYTLAISPIRKDYSLFCSFPLAMVKKTMEIGSSDLSWLRNQTSFKVNRLDTLAILARLGINQFASFGLS